MSQKNEENNTGSNNTRSSHDSTKKADFTWSRLVEDVTKKQFWDDFFRRTPCVQSSYLWGLGSGSLMVAHKTRLYKGHFASAFNYGFFTFLVVSSISFLNCTADLNQRSDLIQKAFKQQQIKHVNERQQQQS